MSKEKVIFIIPGFRQKITSKAYVKISESLKTQGYFPILVEIPWRNSTISENCKYFISLYKTIDAPKKYILGFSYGAMIAFVASTKVSVSGLILCSLSPYFSEDISSIQDKNISSLMEARFKDFSTLHFSALVKKLKTKQVLMLYGKQEARVLVRRVLKAFEQIDSKHKSLMSIKKTEHDISDEKYISTISKAVDALL